MKQFDLRDVIATWGSFVIDGAGDGDFIVVKYDSERVTEHEGGQGDVTALISPSQKGTATIIIGQASSTNDKFAAAAMLQRKKGNGLVKAPFMLRHINSTLGQAPIAFAPDAYIRIEAEAGYADAHKNREWVLGLSGLVLNVAGSAR